jgi:hypothetical protein
VPKGAAGSRATRNVITMSNREIGASQALRIRVADLNERMRGARITENDLKTFRRSQQSWRAARAESMPTI